LASDPRPISDLLLEKVDSNKLASNILRHAAESRNEEDLKIRFEDELRSVLKEWGIQWASYEHRLKISGREDSLYGTVIIEYKTPGRLETRSEFSKAKEQIKGYIEQEAGSESKYGKYFGVVTDGYKIAFVRYRANGWLEQSEPLQVNGQTILRLLESIRGLRRKPIDSEQLLVDFGPRSEISRRTIQILYNALADKNTPRTEMLFNDWRRVFSQVCSYSPDKFTSLASFYGLKAGKDIDVERLLFAIHTYYTILMKLLTSEIVTLFADSLLGSYLKRIEEAYYRGADELLVELRDLEEGGIFSSLGIRNFLEADYFGWYLDEWNSDVGGAIYQISKKLLDYEPATVELNPERVEDLFKRLYQNLVPRDIRHSIGEYFTPDWLAELVLDEVGYDGNPDRRVLDPACGSGTFIVQSIRRIREYAEEHFVDQRELLMKITNNVRGIDLNPLAVLASKANYLIALSDLLRYRPMEGMDLPIFLADSISVVQRVTPYGEDEFELQTNEGAFWVTKEVIDKNILHPVLSIISEGVKVGLSRQQFELALSKDIPLRKDSIQSLARLYDKLLKLEKLGKNRIWTSLLKNSFSPMLIGKFDYVIGNPPWINWENLPEFYRNSTKQLWETYNLIGRGSFKRDISMLFVARCFDLYVAETGKLSFLVPFTGFKSAAGAGFRSWLANKTEVDRIHDLVELYPFEGAVNRTSLLVIQRGKSAFPIQAVTWHNPSSKGMNLESQLKDVKRATLQNRAILAPIEEGKPQTPWMLISQHAYASLKSVLGPSIYSAQEGINTRGANGIFFIEPLKEMGELVMVKNKPDESRIRYIEKTGLVEQELVFPLLRGYNVKRWYCSCAEYILVPYNTESGTILSLDLLKREYPKAYLFFRNFEKELTARTHYGKAITGNFPFYTLFQVNQQTFARHKVVWKEIAGKISGKGMFTASVVEPDSSPSNKIVIPDHKLMFVPCDSNVEAHFLASILNSSLVRLVVMSYTIETAMSTHILEHVRVPKFNPNNRNHTELSTLGMKCYNCAKKWHETADAEAGRELNALEAMINSKVAEVYEISTHQLKEMEDTLAMFQGKV
jgi:hypothetical protein